jgi:hypothetical protein
VGLPEICLFLGRSRVEFNSQLERFHRFIVLLSGDKGGTYRVEHFAVLGELTLHSNQRLIPADHLAPRL